ncbi:MAG: hypothetical protein JNK74_16310 [Candidatus Hydrogenedentes bacterium]|nr:hypothetical protein [Candidatus Hydrogenedentota bacterium]
MDTKAQGAWIIHHAGKLEEYGTSAGMDNLRKAGNCGVLLSALSASDEQNQLSNEKVRTLAEVAGLDLTYQLPALLETLKDHALIDLGQNSIEVLGLTTRTVLEHTGNIFNHLDPKPIEIASLDAAELCSQAPRTDVELGKYLSNQYHLARKDVNQLIETVETYKLCDMEPLDSLNKLYFNGALFRGDHVKKAKAVLDSLTAVDRTNVQSVDQLLTAEGCIEKKIAVQTLGVKLFKKLQSIGMYDVNTVSNNRETVEYITRPSAFNKFGRSDISDAFDLAKAFVASLEYGMSRSASGRGRIVFLKQLMEKLIAGSAIGPCTAIGQDYRVLELRGVVQVIPTRGQMFSMRLLKRDIGKLALQVLQSGDASDQSLTVLPGSPLNAYSGPEYNRVQARKQAHAEKIDVRQALETLRTTSL